jgi:hypothetical protein
MSTTVSQLGAILLTNQPPAHLFPVAEICARGTGQTNSPPRGKHAQIQPNPSPKRPRSLPQQTSAAKQQRTQPTSYEVGRWVGRGCWLTKSSRGRYLALTPPLQHGRIQRHQEANRKDMAREGEGEDACDSPALTLVPPPPPPSPWVGREGD